MAFAIMRFTKLKGGAVSASDKHTDRERETLNADETKIDKNIYFVGEKGTPLRHLVDEQINSHGGKPRKDSVECVEFLMTASPEFFSNSSKTIEFVRQSKQFMENLENRGMKFVKACVHLDETTPHIAAYAVPFDENGKLNAKSHLGGKEKLSALQDEYAEVMQPLGLERGTKGSIAEHQKVQTYYGKINMLEQTQEQLAIAQTNQERSRQMIEQTNQLLQNELNSRTDISLRDAALAFAKNTLETSQGLAILSVQNPSEIKAIVTPDNQAFYPNGENISNGSSVMMLTKIANIPPEQALTAIEKKFDTETASCAARAYGDELSQKTSEKEGKEYNEQKKSRDFSDAQNEAEGAQKIKEVEHIQEEIEIEVMSR
jgi:hypothetical protein